MNPDSRILVAGAGSIGCYVGGCLALAGRDVTFLTRKPLAGALAQNGMRISSMDKTKERIAPASLKLVTDADSAFDNADIILVTVKCGATKTLAEQMAGRVREDAVVVSLQNGVQNADILRTHLGHSRTVVAGMVPFNVMQTRIEGEPPSFHRATSGTIWIAPGAPGLRGALNVASAPVAEHDDMMGVLWSKLVLNLNNALNALSGMPLVDQLSDRRWRRLLAGQMDEALAALKAAGIGLTRVEGVHPRMIPFALRLPDPLFRLAAKRMLSIDPRARSSMWEDFEAGRATEIDYIQGVIVNLAERHGLPAPLNRRVAERVRQVEGATRGAPRIEPSEIQA